MEEVKKGKNFYHIVYHRIKAGDYPNKIARDLFPNNPRAKQKLNYYVSFLKNKGIISHEILYGSVRAWKILKEVSEEELSNLVKSRGKKNFSIGERKALNEVKKNLTNIHAFNIKFPIIAGKIQDSNWEIKNKLNNWLPKYKQFTEFQGLTVRNNNNKSINIFLFPRDIDLREDPYYVEKLGMRIKTYIYEYFRTKHGVILDILGAETKNLHLETQDNDKLQGILKKGEYIEVDLGREAKKIFPKDHMPAKAWLDNSPDPNRIGTNDLTYKRELLFMPERVKAVVDFLPKFQEALAGYAREIQVHREVQKKQLENLEQQNHLQEEQLKTQAFTLKTLNELREEVKKINQPESREFKSYGPLSKGFWKKRNGQSKLGSYFSP